MLVYWHLSLLLSIRHDLAYLTQLNRLYLHNLLENTHGLAQYLTELLIYHLGEVLVLLLDTDHQIRVDSAH